MPVETGPVQGIRMLIAERKNLRSGSDGFRMIKVRCLQMIDRFGEVIEAVVERIAARLENGESHAAAYRRARWRKTGAS